MEISLPMKKAGRKIFYPNILDHKPGFFLGLFLYRLFKRASVDESMKEDLKQMHKEGTVVYAIKYKGKLDYLLYHYNFRRRRLPYPKIAFDLNMSMILPFSQVVRIVFSHIASLFRYGRFPSPYKSGFYKSELQQGTTSLMFLVDPEGFVRHFIHSEMDQVQFLLETQRDMDRPIFIVPQLILYKKTPEKDYSSLTDIFFGYKDHPGVIRKIVLFFRYNRKAFIDFGRPLDLKAYLESQPPDTPLPVIATGIRQRLIESIDNQKRIILGPIMKSRQQFKEIVLMDKRVSEKIQSMSSENKKKLRQMKKRAGEYFDEIAADYNITYIQFFHVALNWFWNKIFEGIHVDTAALAKVRDWARKGTLVYVPSHKSHIDYLILNYVLYTHHMHIPRVAAGKNLAFWPMGHIFRKSGAFFIRRSFSGATLYLEVFNRYIKALLEEEHPIEFFIEGGRSRNGKLVLPKTGFLSILLQAYQEGFCKDVIFVPTSIIYDRIIEEDSYIKELGGGSKKGESLKQILRARRYLKKKYGKIYVQFNEAFSLKEYLSQTNPSGEITHRELAFHLVQSINDVSLVIPLSLVATAILANHRRGFHISELNETVDIFLKFLIRKDVPLAESLNEPAKAVQDTLALLVNWKVIDSLGDTPGEEAPFHYVDEDKKLELEFYKNNIIHFFIPHAFVAISLLSGKEEVRDTEAILSDYAFLKHLFKHEFVFDEKEDPKEKIIAVMAYFLDAAFINGSEDEGGYKVTKLGHDKLPIWAALAKTFIESYWIAVKSMSGRQGKVGKREDLLKEMNYLGRRFHKLGVVEHIGALSELNYKNAVIFINEDIIKASNHSEDPSALNEQLSQLGRRLYELSHYRS
jgi:glycerol-3-phosphate O-acyltransferase